MILVIADDFSGAAEIGAVGMRHGLSTIVTTGLDLDVAADLVVVDTNSRSVPEAQARARLDSLADSLDGVRPAWIYKKIDSVLRGHVLAEIRVLLQRLGWGRSLIVPANPSLGRTLRNGAYYIDDVPLHRTSFASDAEFPAHTSNALELLHDPQRSVWHTTRIGSAVPEKRILIGDAATGADVVHWTASVAQDVLPAGGADFFAALLATRGHRSAPAVAPAGSTGFSLRSGLYVVGSRTPESLVNMRRLAALGYDGSGREPSANGGSGSDEDWADRLRVLLRERERVILGGRPENGAARADGCDPHELVRVATGVLATERVQEVIVEGGSTASLLVRALGWKSFVPIEELGRGIVRMEVCGQDDVHLTVKPGSYIWPEPPP